MNRIAIGFWLALAGSISAQAADYLTLPPAGVAEPADPAEMQKWWQQAMDRAMANKKPADLPDLKVPKPAAAAQQGPWQLISASMRRGRSKWLPTTACR